MKLAGALLLLVTVLLSVVILTGRTVKSTEPVEDTKFKTTILPDGRYYVLKKFGPPPGAQEVSLSENWIFLIYRVPDYKIYTVNDKDLYNQVRVKDRILCKDGTCWVDAPIKIPAPADPAQVTLQFHISLFPINTR